MVYIHIQCALASEGAHRVRWQNKNLAVNTKNIIEKRERRNIKLISMIQNLGLYQTLPFR